MGACVNPMNETTNNPNMPTTTGEHCKVFEKTISKTLRSHYLLFLPSAYGKKQQKWPLILFLHGAGERGDDLNMVKIYGPPKYAEQNADFPFIIVAPQCPEDHWWPNELEVLTNLLDDVISHYDVDTERVYLTGLSMGGYGTWSLASEYPERFAAIAPFCGGGLPVLEMNRRRLKDIPIWAFHGAKDDVVPLAKSKEMVEAVKSYGGNVKFTVYPDADHDCWNRVYNSKELYDWFLQHRKIKKASESDNHLNVTCDRNVIIK